MKKSNKTGNIKTVENSKKYLIIPEKIKKYFNLKLAIIVLIVLFVFIKYKSAFFVALFIAINLMLTYLSREFEIFNPLKIMDYAVFMCAYTYGYKESLILAAAALVLLPFSGKFTVYRLIMTLALFFQAVIGANLIFMNIAIAGIIVLTFKFMIGNIFNLIIFHDLGTPSKILKRVLDFVFWIGIYLFFGQQLYLFMR
ncbi:MAG: hypothetical protein V1859_04770 [archaeon]